MWITGNPRFFCEKTGKKHSIAEPDRLEYSPELPPPRGLSLSFKFSNTQDDSSRVTRGDTTLRQGRELEARTVVIQQHMHATWSGHFTQDRGLAPPTKGIPQARLCSGCYPGRPGLPPRYESWGAPLQPATPPLVRWKIFRTSPHLRWLEAPSNSPAPKTTTAEPQGGITTLCHSREL